MSTDQNYHQAVDLEADKLARLSACELMALNNEEKVVHIENTEVTVNILIQDYGDIRHIGIIASRKSLVGHRNFFRGIIIELNSRRMTDTEAAEIYD